MKEIITRESQYSLNGEKLYFIEQLIGTSEIYGKKTELIPYAHYLSGAPTFDSFINGRQYHDLDCYFITFTNSKRDTLIFTLVEMADIKCAHEIKISDISSIDRDYKASITYSEYYSKKQSVLSEAPYILISMVGAAIDITRDLVNKKKIDSRKRKIKTTHKALKFDINMNSGAKFSFGCVDLNDMGDYNMFFENCLGPKLWGKKTNTSCYIATVCYGNYKTPEVQTFLKFRDNVLMKYFWGRIVVKLYYLFSPPLANWLQKRPSINKFIKIYILDKIYNRLR